MDIGAVGLYGSNVKISRVKAINWGTSADECCVMIEGALSQTAPSTNLLIEDCIVTQPAPVAFTTGADGFGFVACATNLAAIAGPGWVVGAEIRNCRCFNILTTGVGNPLGFFNGIGLGNAVYGEKIDGNLFINVSGQCMAGSCGSMVDCVIDNNMMLGVLCNGICLPGSDVCPGGDTSVKRNIRISNNMITVDSGGTAMYLSGIFGQSIDGLDIENNLVKTDDNKPGGLTGINVDYAKNLTIKNNTLDVDGGTTFTIGANAQISQVSGNQNLAGSLVTPTGWVATNAVTQLIAGNGISIGTQATSAGEIETLSLGVVTNTLAMTSVGTAGNVYLVYTNPDNQNINLGFSSNPYIQGTGNTVFGFEALWQGQSTCSYNTAFGIQSLMFMTNGIWNTAVGSGALGHELSANDNVAVGMGCLAMALSSYNTGIGTFALCQQTTGWGNTAIGDQVMKLATNGSENTVIGTQSGWGNYSGNGNIIVGQGSGAHFNSSFNILIGTDVEVPLPDIGGQMNIGGVIFGNGLKPTDSDNASPYAGNIGLFTTNLSRANFTVNGTALLQGNVTVTGALTISNGVSTTLSNTLPAVAVAISSSPYFWTNTTPQNLVVYINGLRGSVGYNGALLFGPVTNAPITVMLQPKSYLSITNTTGSPVLNWHAF